MLEQLTLLEGRASHMGSDCGKFISLRNDAQMINMLVLEYAAMRISKGDASAAPLHSERYLSTIQVVDSLLWLCKGGYQLILLGMFLARLTLHIINTFAINTFAKWRS